MQTQGSNNSWNQARWIPKRINMADRCFRRVVCGLGRLGMALGRSETGQSEFWPLHRNSLEKLGYFWAHPLAPKRGFNRPYGGLLMALTGQNIGLGAWVSCAMAGRNICPSAQPPFKTWFHDAFLGSGRPCQAFLGSGGKE